MFYHALPFLTNTVLLLLLLHFILRWALIDSGKFKLIIWPEHCLIGTKGFCMVDEVHQALQNWSMATGGTIEWVLKGENLLTESYSALVRLS